MSRYDPHPKRTQLGAGTRVRLFWTPAPDRHSLAVAEDTGNEKLSPMAGWWCRIRRWLWYSVEDIPSGRIRRVIDFGERAASHVDDGAPAEQVLMLVAG